MNEIERIVQRYEQTLSGDAWYGYPVWTILEGIDAQCAATEFIPGTHTIWQLVMHMEFWERIAARRLSGPVTPEEAGKLSCYSGSGRGRVAENSGAFPHLKS